MQVTGNHQKERIVRHNDESEREGYIRNGGKELEVPRNLESSRVSSPGFDNDSKMMVINRRNTSSDLSRHLSSATGTTVSSQTVYRRLGHIGLYARRPVRCVPLTATHCRLRLTWRTPGTRFTKRTPLNDKRYGGAGWLVWGGIILGSRTDLHVQSVTMTGHIYRDVILEQHVRLFRGARGAEFLFMDDNARPHRANIVDECLQSEDISRMDWPAYAPDLNPIEQVWDMLGRRIAARQPPPTCLPELRRALLDEWCNIPQNQIDNLILSVPRRFAFPARPRHALLAKDLVTWQVMVGRHILEDIVGRVAQYVDEHYPVDKWHLGDLIAWVAQSALKYRPRICELSKCLEGPLKMIVCPKKLLTTLSHLVKLLYAARQ
ncbi:transposable element Tc3 transposase [Trichonephila clavipes]|nr:transposable element Tc3 transposase [Trichonephila clavipes]